jgi:nucleotide-binding universal stress UspA family protein
MFDPEAPILVALDPDAPGEEAERLALTLARALGSAVVLGTVFPLIRLRSYVHSRRYERLLHEEAERFLGARAERWRESGAEIAVTTAAVGSPSAARGLHALARERGAGLVVVGPSRRHGGGWTVPGPMGSRFAHGAPCPVVVATGTIPEQVERIGVAFSPTDDGRAALGEAASLASRCGAVLRAISVAGALPWVDVVQPEFEGATLPELYGGHLAHELDAAVSELPSSVAVETEVPSGAPVEVLAAATAEVDLMVCGSRGHGPLGEVVLGSTSHALLEQARCPLLIVPAAAGEERSPQTRASQSRSLSA